MLFIGGLDTAVYQSGFRLCPSRGRSKRNDYLTLTFLPNLHCCGKNFLMQRCREKSLVVNFGLIILLQMAAG